MREIILLALVASCTGAKDVRKLADNSLQTIPFEMGGSQITFSGLQLEQDADTRCIVELTDKRETIEIRPFIPFDRLSAICRLPSKVAAGRVDINLEITNNSSSTSETHSGSFIVHPNPIPDLKVTENFAGNEVSFTWDADYFQQFYEPGGPVLVEAALLISDNGQPDFIESGVTLFIGMNNAGTGKVTISAANLDKISAFLYPYYYILRTVGTRGHDIYLSSGLYTPTVGKSEGAARDICGVWLGNATGPPEDIDPCPPCLCKAKLDGNFIPAEYQPQIVELAEGKLGRHVLYYQRVPTDQGHAQTCSYNTATDALATSSPVQAGWVHYVSKDVSYAQNYLSDIWPYIVCCLQSNSEDFCLKFHEKRPVDTGHTYPGPDDPCYGTGDPHMSTFDGVRYDFMGYGEFWLIKGPAGSGFGVQGRMAPTAPDQKVSYYTALAMRDGNTSVQFQHRNGVLEVLVNGLPIQIPAQGLPTLPLDSISLEVTGIRVLVRFRTGFTIYADSYGWAFNVYGSGAHENRGKGYAGIFGLFDADPQNDLSSQDGFVVEPTQANLVNLSLIHNVFGLSWATTPEESLFVYDDGYTWANYSNPDFGPILTYPDPADFSDEVRAICGTSLACYYEYVGTGELKDAEETVGAEKEHDELVEEIAKKIPMCDTIPAPANGRVSAEGYLSGSTATYSCLEEYEIIDEVVTRTCVATEEAAEWDGAEPTCVWTCTRCPFDAEYLLSHDPSDCSKFFLCSNGMRFALDCPAGEVFSREMLVCGSEYECPEPSCSITL